MRRLEVRFAGSPGIRDSDWIPLAPGVSVLTGRNNVGKSRMLQSIEFLQQGLRGPVNEQAPILRIVDDQWRLEVDLRGAPSPRLYTGTDVALNWSQQEATWVATASNASGQQTFNYGPAATPSLNTMLGLTHAQDVLDEVGRLLYVPSQRIIQTNVNATPLTVPNTTGSDLGQVIYTHKARETPEFDEFHATITEMLPEISRILADPTAGTTVTIKLRDRYVGMDIPVSETGTGVGQLMHLVASVLFREPGRVLLVDEPQLHLHPGAEKLLAQFIRRHSEHSYMFATHSNVFITAIDPDRAWLLTRDQMGTAATSVFDEGLTTAHVLNELGLTPGDISLAERVLFVEGPADVGIYPYLLAKIGFDIVRANCHILQLRGADNSRPLRDVIAELADLLRLRFLLVVDGDQIGKLESGPHVQFLPAVEIENVLLRDPLAVRMGFQSVLAETAPEGFDVPAWENAWPAERIGEFISSRLACTPTRKGSAILAELAYSMGNLIYKKTVHGPRIAQFVDVRHLQDLRGPFSALFA